MNQIVNEKLDAFFAQFKNQKYKKGEILIRADEEPKGVFYLSTGRVKQYAISAHGDELVLNIFKPVSFFPMSWVLNNSSPPHYYEAMTSLEVRKAPREDVRKFIENEREVMHDLLSRIYRGLEGVWLKMEHMMSGNSYLKLVTELLIFAKRFGEREGRRYTVDFKTTEKELAAQTGIARETVSRSIQLLKKKRLISFKSNQLVIFDIAKLEQELLPG